MKRVGERGEGRFERISWDEALKTVADKLRETVEKYGNESLYWQYCSGQQSLVNSRRAWWRLLNLCGGYLKYYGSYSTAQISAAFPMTYGASPSSDISEIANAKLYVTFGHNPAVTRGSGHGKSWQMTCTREAEGGRKPKMIVIDPIYSDTAVAHADEWIPIRPGTDAALVEAIAHELIVHDRVDHAFLAQYCVGYDEGTLPASAPKGSDYKSHILGKGPDGIEKTPEWASRITGVPVETIVRLAEEIGTTKPVFFSQGWGPQRQANGEQTSRAIAMLPILTGNVGLPGTSTGQQEGNTAVPAVYLPVGTNPVKATIPCFLWTDAIVRGREMDDVHDGLRGVKTLGHDIKMIVNSGGNTLINQHSDSNRTDEILRDTSKCEFIVVCDNMMTPSARYADILLPDTLGPEADDVTASENWVLPKGDVISPIPMFVRTWEMPGDALQKKYPLQCYGYHGHGRIHSTFHNLPALREQFPDEVLVNVLDADARGIRSGDRVRVFNDRGAVELVAKVTPRIIPGVVSIPQGAWYRPVMKDGRRVDVGGNINTLTSLRPSPLAKGNPQHTNLVEVVKA